ncbi:LacI family DNA-binding transcriptional regulator [Clostridium algidicarnis]|uniref:LacI family transcriptional regulator n=1 Tax=Clostridium algidicarnis DSM 15099 TaxID=1121295 RepID=A0A2S6FXQ4_9CLOT|nr:LacI family DNA-binding transcriptional regulator [Clostridium algidicarnis]MBU3192448.1 LacI family transcriptional regulator [Clostridium algidicarnis]MBU3206468.1 LacI family transcriptional regulator [Clostridium algidicarnis]PPK48334.1 LacI family transcriptional regulator [Clostridium algidicarnis DSM 15099]
MKIKLKDIAKEANVSITSVSLVLNNKPCRISSEKKDLIKKIAKDNNYTPNINARSLITNETKTLGLIIPDIENIFFSRLTKTIETYCRQFGYALIIVNSNDEYKEDLYLLDLLLARGIDGLFITISNSAYNNKEEVCLRLKKLTIPYIMIDRVFDELNCNQVYFDNVKGSYLATKHLIENGHSKISCITNSIYSKNTVSRFEGYKKAMQEHGLEIKKDYIIEGDYRMQSGYNTGDMIIKNHTTAVFVTNDMMTLGLLKRLSEKDIKVPEYLSIVSYDNLLNDFILGPGITSINQNISNLGKTACDLMLSLIKNEETAIKKICLDPELIIKKSVKNIV